MSQAHAENAVQVAAYAKVSATRVSWPRKHPGSIPVLVRVVAPPATSGRAPIDLVAVLDVSCCGGQGPVNRIDLLEKAMKHITNKLSKDDRLAIVPVQPSTVAEKYDLMNMDANGREAAITWVKSLVPAGDNKLLTGLNKAAEILKKRDEKDVRKKPGFIILISDGDDGSVLCENYINPDHSIHAFGFRDAHNAKPMYHIANRSAGTYGILNDVHDGLTDAFATSINNITSIVAIDTRVDITDSPAELTGIESGRFTSKIEDDKKSGFILARVLHGGAERSFIVYVDNDKAVGGKFNLNELTVTVRYEDRSTSQQAEAEAEAESQVHKMAQQTAKAVVVEDDDDNSRLVALEIVRVEAIRIVGEIIKKYGDNGRALGRAAEELHKQWCDLKESDYGKEAARACFLSRLDAEMEEMETTLRKSSDISYMLSWQTCYSLQNLQHTRSSSSTSVAAKGKGGSSAAARQSFTAGGAAMGKFVCSGAHHGGGGERKRKYQQYHQDGTELEMIKQRLAYWSKVKYELPPMHHDGECPDHMTTIFHDASRESIDRAMFHDVFLAVVHATGRKSSESGGGGEYSSCGL